MIDKSSAKLHIPNPQINNIMKTVKQALVVATMGLTSLSCALTNATIQTVEVEEAKPEVVQVPGPKVNKWFGLVPDVNEFDADGDGQVNPLEYYSYHKKLRVLMSQAPFISEADTDGNSYTAPMEWRVHIAKLRANGEWLEHVDEDGDGKVSQQEELDAVSFLERAQTYYESNYQYTCTQWANILDGEALAEEVDTNGDYTVSREEVQAYLAANRITFMFYFDYNENNKMDVNEAMIAHDVVNKVFAQVQEYLQKLKAFKYKDFS